MINSDHISEVGAWRREMGAQMRSSDGSVDLDFSKIYLPPCAFCDFTTCPTSPKSNVFPFALEAGEHFPIPQWSRYGVFQDSP